MVAADELAMNGTVLDMAHKLLADQEVVYPPTSISTSVVALIKPKAELHFARVELSECVYVSSV